MWYSIFKFELAYRMRRPETYVFFLFLFLFSLIGVDFIFQGVELGVVKKNASLVIAKTMGAITGIFMILSSMIMGVPVLRDFQYKIEPLIFVNPISKKEYLLGKFLGSFLVLVLIFSGIFFGMIIGELMPWHDPKDYLDFNIGAYVSSFMTVTLPTLFFGASLFFVTGALSRKLVVVYTQGIFLFVIFILTKAITNDFWQAIFDPFSLTTLTYITDGWSALDKNNLPIPLANALLLNKLFWVSLGVVALLVGYRKFSFTIAQNKRSRKNQGQLKPSKSIDTNDVSIPTVAIHQGKRAKWTQLKEFTRFYFFSICQLPSFWAIVICGMIIILINSVNLGTVYGVDSFPATYLIVEELQETSMYFFMMLLLFYSGELIWKERSENIHLIYDATTMSSFVNLLGKYFALLGIYILLMLALMVSGVIFQLINGYYEIEFQVYFYGFIVEILPFLALYSLVAFFIQTVVNNKFLAVFLLLVFFIIVNLVAVFGYDHSLYLFGGSSLGSYSEMNGYGGFLLPFVIVKSYWLFFGMILLVVSSLLITRGTPSNLKNRFRSMRLSKPMMKFTTVLLIVFVLLGGYIFYNTNVLNEYWSTASANTYRASYENTLKQFEYLPQPKLTDVSLQVELYPSSKAYTIEGSFMLNNTSQNSINEIHVQEVIESNVTMDYLNFEGGAKKDTTYNKFHYHRYHLNKPLQPNDSVQMNFKQTYTTKGFTGSVSNENIAANGTFINNDDLPRIGYNKKYELSDNNVREEFELPTRANKAQRNDLNELLHTRSGSFSNGINFKLVIGTEEDQIALAPGTRVNQWSTEDRSYFQYQMNEPITNFYAMVSARYDVKKDVWKPELNSLGGPVDLEIYYHPKHHYNLDRMMQGMKASFDYYSAHFSPYQYDHLRIMEFPRYAQFAQSFPGTVPFSESIGFILDINDEKDVDMVFFITAHEIAHQWFGMQVEAANVQGRNLILETLSQYAALMVLKTNFSEEKIEQFLAIQHKKYREGRNKDGQPEPSLALVENQEYVYYAKGAIVMHQLEKEIGEDKVNEAIRNFIRDWNTKDGVKKRSTQRYATTKDLLVYFQEVCPLESQYLITNLFETVTPLQATPEAIISRPAPKK